MIERDIVENVSVYQQKVAPAVVIKIKKSRSETAVAVIGLADSRGNGGVDEGASPLLR